MASPKTPKDVIAMAKEAGAMIVDLRFTDLPGQVQHLSLPIHELTEEKFADGQPFDGSSVRGFQEIQESDMLLELDPSTAYMDPFTKHPTLNITCFVKDPITGEDYSRDPRKIAQEGRALPAADRASPTRRTSGRRPSSTSSTRSATTRTSSRATTTSTRWRAPGSRAREEEGGNLGYKPRYKGGYFALPPMDKYQDLRTDMVLNLEKVGLTIEVHHHEVGTAGQAEIDMRYDTLLTTADNVMKYKYVVKNTAYQAGKTVTFMPKPLFMDNGSGMHTHQSLWTGGEPLFWDEVNYGGISDLARWYIGGLIQHAPALLAFTNPTTNSYRRLVPGYEAPIMLVYSQRNRERLRADSRRRLAAPRPKRIEFRTPDPSCNPYLAFSAMLMAGLDGIKNKIEPPEPIDKDLYDLPPEEKANVKQVPGDLDEVLDALEADHQWLLEGGVFTQDVIDTWIEYKRLEERDAVRLRPHPHEFALYYDV